MLSGENFAFKDCFIVKIKDYTNHAQLEKSKKHAYSLKTTHIFVLYLQEARKEIILYFYDSNTVPSLIDKSIKITVAKDQTEYEFNHLLKELCRRNKTTSLIKDKRRAGALLIIILLDQYSGGIAGGVSFFSSGFSTTRTSVVNNIPAMEAAFCRALLVTFAGSMIPALNMSVYSPLRASNP